MIRAFSCFLFRTAWLQDGLIYGKIQASELPIFKINTKKELAPYENIVCSQRMRSLH